MVQDRLEDWFSSECFCTHHDAMISVGNTLTGLRTSPPVGGRYRNLTCVQRLPGGLLHELNGSPRLTLSHHPAAGIEAHMSRASSWLKTRVP